MKYLVSIGLVLSLLAPLSAQTVQTDAAMPNTVEKQLQDQIAKLTKANADKDAELAKIKAATTQTPENIEKAVVIRTGEFNKFRETPIVRACKAARGSALITQDSKTGALLYTGCIL